MSKKNNNARTSFIEALNKDKDKSTDSEDESENDKKFQQIKDINISQENLNTGSSGNKIKIVSMIEDLRASKNTYLSQGKFEKAKEIAQKIVEIAGEAGMTSYESDEQKEVKRIQTKINRKQNIADLKKKISVLERDYEKWVSQGNLPRSHKMFQDFIEENEDLEGFDAVEEIKDFIRRDKKLWIKYKAKHRE